MGGLAGGTGTAPVPTRSPPPKPALRARQTEDRDEDAGMDAKASAGGWLHLGHLALMMGAANIVLVIAFFKPGASFRTGLAVFGVVAAFGAWRTGRDFDWSPLQRAVVALLAATPIAGMAVCVLMLFKAMRQRQ